MPYFLAPSLVRLKNEVDARYPGRDIRSDGWIGDPSHAARKSSHNPLWSASGKWSGVVRGIDFDIDDRNTALDLRTDVLEAVIKDARVWYAISNGIIYSRTHGWAPRKYIGANLHFGHVHVSLREIQSAWSSTARWLTPMWRPNPKTVGTLALLQAQAQIVAGVRKGRLERYHIIGQIQQKLGGLTVDGYWGKKTAAAWAKFERAHGGTGRATTPDPKSLRAAGIKFAGPELR